jgi:hypothetical protein
MYYVRRMSTGVCSFYVIRTKDVIRVFGILVTKTSKILFFHQRIPNYYQSMFVINKRRAEIAIYR